MSRQAVPNGPCVGLRPCQQLHHLDISDPAFRCPRSPLSSAPVLTPPISLFHLYLSIPEKKSEQPWTVTDGRPKASFSSLGSSVLVAEPIRHEIHSTISDQVWTPDRLVNNWLLCQRMHLIQRNLRCDSTRGQGHLHLAGSQHQAGPDSNLARTNMGSTEAFLSEMTSAPG